MERFGVATLCHISRSQEQRNMACDVLLVNTKSKNRTGSEVVLVDAEVQDVGSSVQGAVSIGSPSQAANVRPFMQLRSLNLIVCGDEELHDDHFPQSDHATGVPGHAGAVVGVIVVGAEVVVLMVSLLISCFFPVFLYIPFTVHPFSVSNEIGAPLRHLDFFGLQLGTTFETLLQSSS